MVEWAPKPYSNYEGPCISITHCRVCRVWDVWGFWFYCWILGFIGLRMV